MTSFHAAICLYILLLMILDRQLDRNSTISTSWSVWVTRIGSVQLPSYCAVVFKLFQHKVA